MVDAENLAPSASVSAPAPAQTPPDPTPAPPIDSSPQPSRSSTLHRVVSFSQAPKPSDGSQDEVVRLRRELASLKQETSKAQEHVAGLQQKIDDRIKQAASLEQKIRDGQKEVDKVIHQVKEKDKEIEKLKLKLRKLEEKEATAVKTKEGWETRSFFSSDPNRQKCMECGRPRVYTEGTHHNLSSKDQDYRWMSHEMDVVGRIGELYSQIQHHLTHNEELAEVPDLATTADSNKPHSDRGSSIQCALIYTDCMQTLDVRHPPAALAIHEIPTLMHQQIDRFLIPRRLPEFHPSTYNWFTIPSLPLDRAASTFQNFANVALVLNPKRHSQPLSSSISQLRCRLKHMSHATQELVRLLLLHENSMAALWRERCDWYRGLHPAGQSLLAGMLSRLQAAAAAGAEEAARLRALVRASEERGKQQASSLQHSKTALECKEQDLASAQNALHTWRGQEDMLHSRGEGCDREAEDLRRRLALVTQPMCHIWVATFLESVRRRIVQDLCVGFADVIPLEDASDSMDDWNAVLARISDTPDACALLDSKGLHRDGLEITRLGARYSDGHRTLHDLGNAAATSAGKEEVAEAIASLEVPHSYRSLLKQLYAYMFSHEPLEWHITISLSLLKSG